MEVVWVGGVIMSTMTVPAIATIQDVVIRKDYLDAQA